MDTKVCSKCGLEKALSEFSIGRTGKGGKKSTCKMCDKERRQKYFEKNRDKVRDSKRRYVERNREAVRDSKTRHAENNKEEIKEYKKLWVRARQHSDPIYALKHRLRSLTRNAFISLNVRKSSKTMVLLGCSGADLLAMWGVDMIPEGFHIDHIVPLSQAITEEELKTLCHYSNLRIIPAEENLSKSDSKTDENAALCIELLGREWID
jgi:hypothetical protein